MMMMMMIIIIIIMIIKEYKLHKYMLVEYSN